jgi:tetratricopeptide (TPR) repeat protein
VSDEAGGARPGATASERATSKRLVALETMAASRPDTLTLYGLAMEYRSLGRADDAEQAFARLRDHDPAYVPTYHQAGALLLQLGRRDEARAWIEQGIERARQKGDTHALSELQDLLASA